MCRDFIDISVCEERRAKAFFRGNRACKRAVEHRIFQLGEARAIYKPAHMETRARKRGHGGWYERVACDIEAGLSSLARCLPNTVKVHVNYRINLDSGLCLGQRWRSARVIKTFLSPDGSSTQTGVPIISI
jgi:hypothetical protein